MSSDLAVYAGSAIPDPMGGTVTTSIFGVTVLSLRLPTSLLVGLAATAIAWLALLFVVAHGRYVTTSVAAGEYEKGPFRDRGPRAGSELVDLEGRDEGDERERDGDE